MFDPAWEKGCPSCTWYIDSLGKLSKLNDAPLLPVGLELRLRCAIPARRSCQVSRRCSRAAASDDVFHTYSAYARGTEPYGDARALLDATPYGRQQEFEESPPGWPQHPTYG